MSLGALRGTIIDYYNLLGGTIMGHYELLWGYHYMSLSIIRGH